jgi:hypothetical protein
MPVGQLYLSLIAELRSARLGLAEVVIKSERTPIINEPI